MGGGERESESARDGKNSSFSFLREQGTDADRFECR